MFPISLLPLESILIRVYTNLEVDVGEGLKITPDERWKKDLYLNV